MKNESTKVDAQMWREACEDGRKAKALLTNLRVPQPDGQFGEVKFAGTADGKQIPIAQISEASALDFVRQLAPSWCGWTGLQ